MGGGPISKEEVKRKIPAPLPDGGQGEGLAETNGGSAPDFCELTQVVGFEATEPAAIAVGMRVRLLPQHLPQVLAGGRAVGFVTEPDATAMRNCIEEGFTMSGSIRSFSAASGGGELTLAGVNGGR